MNPLLSIIVPFYGSADPVDLHRCEASLKRQGLNEGSYEVIVVDDDGKGLGAARNKGMRQAHGTYLLFLDADDVLLPSSLSYCVDLLRMYQPDMLSFGYIPITSVVGIDNVESEGSVEVYVSGAEYMAHHNFMGTAWRHLFLREWLDHNQLCFAEEVYHEDEAFVAKAYFLAGTTVITDKLVYGYMQSEVSILNNTEWEHRKKRMDDFMSLLLDLKSFLASHLNSSSELQHKALIRRLSFLTIDFLLQLRRNRCPIGDGLKYFKQLKKNRLLPLPDGHYSNKYTLARCIINPVSFFV